MKIDFYILEAASNQQSLLFACRLIEKLHAEQKQLFIQTDSLMEAERLDGLLWTYREDGFIPHNLYREDDAFPPAVQIGFSHIPSSHQDTLLNLSRHIPNSYTQFQHVIEIVFPDPTLQQLARERYRQYRDQGHELNTQKIKTHEM